MKVEFFRQGETDQEIAPFLLIAQQQKKDRREETGQLLTLTVHCSPFTFTFSQKMESRPFKVLLDPRMRRGDVQRYFFDTL